MVRFWLALEMRLERTLSRGGIRSMKRGFVQLKGVVEVAIVKGVDGSKAGWGAGGW